MKKILLFMFTILFFTTGCTTMNSSEDDNKKQINPEPISHEAESEDSLNKDRSIKPDYTKYKQSKRKLEDFKEDVQNMPGTDIFTNEEADNVMDHLRSKNEIIDAQVAISGDNMYVAVKLNKNADQDIGNKVERQVREVVQNKDIIVYTDYSDWQRAKDESASKDAASIGKDVENLLENFFNINVKE